MRSEGDEKDKVLKTEEIESLIVTIREQKVVVDRDLAQIYGVETRRLNEQVKRNPERFPEDFLFQLTTEEAGRWFCSRSQFATLKRGKNIKYLPVGERSPNPSLLGGGECSQIPSPPGGRGRG